MQMFLFWKRKAIGYDYLIHHRASWAALAKLKIPITLVQGPFPTELSHCWIIIKLKSKGENILQSTVGPWSYTVMITDTDFPRNVQCTTAMLRSPHSMCYFVNFVSGAVVSWTISQMNEWKRLNFFLPLLEPFLFFNYIWNELLNKTFKIAQFKKHFRNKVVLFSKKE